MTGLDADSVPVVEYVGVLLDDAATPADRLNECVGVPDAPDDALAVELIDTDAPRVRLPERVLVVEKLVVRDGVEVKLAAEPVAVAVADALAPTDTDAINVPEIVALSLEENDASADAAGDGKNDDEPVCVIVVD